MDEKKYDLLKIAEINFQTAKDNTIELNKITANLFGYLFPIATFFLGFTMTLNNILGGLNKWGTLLLIVSIISGVVTIILAILNILYNRQDINYIIDIHIGLSKKCYKYIDKNGRFVEKIPEDLIFENIYNNKPKKLSKPAMYAFFIQIISCVLIIFTKIDFQIILK